MEVEKCICGKKAELYGTCWECLERDRERTEGRMAAEPDTESLGEDFMRFHQ